MELLYLYASKYRIFENQGFSFSDKFFVKYQPEDTLEIRKNEDYFDLYPGNIVGISGIVGKNATGKSSLLALIGNKPEDRQRDESMEHAAYFLLYYAGKQEGQDIFLLETNNPEEYKSMIPGLDLTAAESMENKKNNGLFTYSISCKNGTYGFAPQYLPQVQQQCSVISIQTGIFPQSTYIDQESGVIPRRFAAMNTNALSDQVLFLARQMHHKKEQSILYSRGTYELNIFCGFDRHGASTLRVPEMRGQSMNQGQIMSIFDLQFIPNSFQDGRISDNNVLYSLIAFLLRDYAEKLLNALYDIGYDENIMRIIRKVYKKIFTYVPDLHEKLVICQTQYIELIDCICPLVTESRKVPRAGLLAAQLEKFLRKCTIQTDSTCTEFQITYQITRAGAQNPDLGGQYALKTRLDALQFFLRICSEARWKINFLSDGEAENLAMYASLDYQIAGQEWYDMDDFRKLSKTRYDYSHKQDYILLFDEIERSMHPEMCRRLLSEMIGFFAGYPDKRFQIIIATHSPFLIGDLRRQNLICLCPPEKQEKGPENQKMALNSFGQNIHTLLKQQFFLNQTTSEYACQMIALTAECLDSEPYRTIEEIQQKIEKFMGPVQEGSWKKIPRNEPETLAFLQWVISSIGEPVIRETLQHQLDRYKMHLDYEQNKSNIIQTVSRQMQNFEKQVEEKLWSDLQGQKAKQETSESKDAPKLKMQQVYEKKFKQAFDEILNNFLEKEPETHD